jgi:Arc/MetJ-type ribon-helix-helix transcriptional regulator
MTVTLDAATEARIQHKIELGQFSEPGEVISRALDVLDALNSNQEDWFQRNREALNERLEESMGQAQRGETYPPQQARQILAQRRAQRAG